MLTARIGEMRILVSEREGKRPHERKKAHVEGQY